MAYNVGISVQSGDEAMADQATDGVMGQAKVQFVKLMNGTLGDTTKAIVGANGLAVDASAALRGTYTDRSGTATTTSAPLMAANASRKRFMIQNPAEATTNIYFNFTAAATAGTGSIELVPGASYDSSNGPVSTEAINIIAKTGSQGFTAKEM